MKIQNLYNDQTIMNFKQCYALEKVHGTSAHIKWKDNNLTFYSGGSTHSVFVSLFDEQALIKFFESLGPLESEVRIHGEAYGGKIMGMSKCFGKELKFIAFDVYINDSWLNVPKAEEFCKNAGLEFVPYELVDTSEKSLNHERDRDSIVAIRCGMGEGHIREGVVLRPLQELRQNNGSRIISKHKRDEFREHKSVRSITIDPEKAVVLEAADLIADEWVVPMRLLHVLGKLELNGVELTVKDTGRVILAMLEDVYEEAGSEVTKSKELDKAISKKAARLFAQHLKEKFYESVTE